MLPGRPTLQDYRHEKRRDEDHQEPGLSRDPHDPLSDEELEQKARNAMATIMDGETADDGHTSKITSPGETFVPFT